MYLNGKINIIFKILTILFIAGYAYGDIIQVGSGSYTDLLQQGKEGPKVTLYKSTNVAAPLPSHEWWTTIMSERFSDDLYPHPLSLDCESDCLEIGFPLVVEQEEAIYINHVTDLKVMGLVSGSTITAKAVTIDGYSDWTGTPYWDDANSSEYFKATCGHGLPFVYFEFSSNAQPLIVFPSTTSIVVTDMNGGQGSGTVKVDCLGVKTNNVIDKYYGIFAPKGSSFTMIGNKIKVNFPQGKRFLSIGLMTQASDLSTWFNHAYAFVTDTKVSWEVDTTKSKVTTTFQATVDSKEYGQTTPLLAVFPHQWKNMSSGTSFLTQTFSTLRGTMTILEAGSFQVENEFNGIIPYLPDKGNYDREMLNTYLDIDKNQKLDDFNTYHQGKILCKVASYIPILDQLGDIAARDGELKKLRESLEDWYTFIQGEEIRYFYYNRQWGGMIGYDASYYAFTFTDQHFHYGYFLYASAMLGLYDKDFIDEYGEMVELVLRSFASPYRDDTMFPFLRTFDPYEGHSWAGYTAVNQESSSEAMNAWAGIYLWGLATQNDFYRDLGIWGYTTEYTGIREYYFDIDNTQYDKSIYKQILVSVLGARSAECTAHWPEADAQDFLGIELLPITPLMLYLGYDTTYAEDLYNRFREAIGGLEERWQDIIWKFQSLFDPKSVINKFHDSFDFDSSSSRAALYRWIYTFDVLGTVDTSIYADIPSFNVFDKNGVKTYICYNYTDSARVVTFRRRSDDAFVGWVEVAANSMLTTNTLNQSGYFVERSASSSVSSSFGSWAVTLDMDSETFSDNVVLTLSTTTVLDVDGASLIKTGMGFEVDLNKTLQPQKDITVNVSYSNSDIANLREMNLVLGRYNDGTTSYVLLDTTVNEDANSLSGKTGHLSRFAIFQAVVSTTNYSVSDVVVYPNPYKPGSGTNFDRPGGMVFDKLPLYSKIRIFSIAGEQIFNTEISGLDVSYEWKAVNNSGNRVASGVYIYIVTAPNGQKKKGKLAVIR